MRRIVGAVVVALVLAGCGGTDWKSAVSGNSGHGERGEIGEVRKGCESRAARGCDREDRAVVRRCAGRDELRERPERQRRGRSLHRDRDRARLRRRRIHSAPASRPTELRKPNSSLKSLGAPTTTQVATLGAAFQKCGLGTPVARAMAPGLGTTDPATITCLANRLDTTPAARGYLVRERPGSTDRSPRRAHGGRSARRLRRSPDDVRGGHGHRGRRDDARVPARLVERAPRPSSRTTSRRSVAKGPKSDEVIELRDSLSVDVNRCRPSARTGFTATAGG